MTCSPYESPIAQWLEHPTGIWKVVGLIPVKVLNFFFLSTGTRVTKNYLPCLFVLVKLLASCFDWGLFTPSSSHVSPQMRYRKIPKISPQALYFSKALFEGLIFGRAYIRRGLSTDGNLCFKIDWV